MTWSIALRGLEPSRAMSYLYCVPPLAVAIGALFLDEPVTALAAAGRRARDRRRRGRAARACSKGGDAAERLHRGRRRATMSTLRKRLCSQAGLRPSRCSLSRRSSARTPAPARSSCSAAGGWSSCTPTAPTGARAAVDARERARARCPCARRATSGSTPGARVRLEGTMQDGTLVLADSLSAVDSSRRRRRPRMRPRGAVDAQDRDRPVRVQRRARDTTLATRPAQLRRWRSARSRIAQFVLPRADLRAARVRRRCVRAVHVVDSAQSCRQRPRAVGGAGGSVGGFL